MKRKKVITKERETSVVIYSSDKIRVSKELNGELFFEIENEVTSDMSEAVAMSMSFGIKDELFFDTKFNININKISPDKALYWLTGGDTEWVVKKHYNKAWSDVYLTYQEEFGLQIINIFKKSNTIGDVRNGFIKHMNLPTLYEFSLSKGFIK